mgnify:CR=1 FL=1
MVDMHDGIESALKDADALWYKGLSLLEGKMEQEAETTMRTSLGHLRNAFHLASEDLSISHLLHDRGRIIHDSFGCKLRMSGTIYYRECPVSLSHVQFGFSVGGSADMVCSICGKDPWDCEHITGFKYDGILCQRMESICNICLREKCNHHVGETYNRVEAVHIITKMNVEEVSLVKNPASPLARIQMLTLGPDDIRKELPEAEKGLFVPGETVIHCHHCMDCDGTYMGETQS